MKYPRIRPTFLTLTALLIVASTILAACGAPAADPAAPVATEAPATEPAAPVTTEAPATEAAATEPPQPELGEIIFEEDFADNSNNWNLRADTDVVSVIENGKLTPRLLTFGQNWAFESPVAAENIDLSVDTEFVEGAPENISYGVACQYQDIDNFIRVSIRPNGTYAIYQRVNGEWATTPLVQWTTTNLINQGTGAVNHLRVICTEGHVTLFINDTLVADVVDTSLSGGSFSLMVAASQNNTDDANPVAMSFSNLVVRTPLPWVPPTEILLSDSFDNNDNGWGTFEEDGYSVQILNGQMVMRFDAADYYAFSLPEYRFSNVDMSFDAVVQEGTPTNAAYGAFCRFTDSDNYYDFSIESDGYYRLGKVVAGTWETLIDWTATTAINTGAGETNRIRVVCSGSTLELYANGQLVATTQDTSLIGGGFALLARRFAEDDVAVSVAFDNVEVKYP